LSRAAGFWPGLLAPLSFFSASCREFDESGPVLLARPSRLTFFSPPSVLFAFRNFCITDSPPPAVCLSSFINRSLPSVPSGDGGHSLKIPFPPIPPFPLRVVDLSPGLYLMKRSRCPPPPFFSPPFALFYRSSCEYSDICYKPCPKPGVPRSPQAVRDREHPLLPPFIDRGAISLT